MKDIKTGALVVALVLLIAGCTSALAGMTPEQLAALAQDRNASVTCFSGVYAGAKVNILFVNADKGVPAGIAIDDGCKAQFATNPR